MQQGLDKNKRLYREIFIQVQNAIAKKLLNVSSAAEKLILLNSVLNDAKADYKKIQESMGAYSCARCGACCKFACSSFSPDELAEKSANGDKYANDFTSVFVPKKTIELEFQPYLDFLKENNELENTFFYHCPKVEFIDSLANCPIYENRPSVCRNFPNNPIEKLPFSCSFAPWKDEFEVKSLYLNAVFEICAFLIQQMDK